MVMPPPFSAPETPVLPEPKKKAGAAPPAAQPTDKPSTKPAQKTDETAKQQTTRPPVPPAATEKPARPPRQLGPVEQATLVELKAAGADASALGQAALAMARNVDEADTAAGASAAARELRMVLPLARALQNPLSPPAPSEKPAEDDGTVVSPDRLTRLRKQAAKRAGGRAGGA
jgi:hypothetical protein